MGDNKRALPHDASSRITTVFRQHFADKASISFLHFERYLLLLMRIPSEYNSFKHWTEGEACLLEVIETLKRDYSIHLFMGGVGGGVFQDAMQVKESYSQARKARRKPPIIIYTSDITKI